MSEADGTRRIITGQSPEGKSTYTHLESVEPLRLGGDMLRHIVWGWEELPALPFYEPGPYQLPTGIPSGRPGGVQVEVWVLPPLFPLPGGHENASMMHSYDTIDIVFVIEGEIDLKQSDGVTVRLRRGDVLVQNGTAHAWSNPTDRQCVLGFVFCGTERNNASE
ncbi:cupin domain-containing protein [Sphingobium indicum]|uniref:cupin domain-containing protein n=1 Tax=Sphingobium indicum TaxID=332055 RepID=UPI0009DA279A|nr:cupin domain-containing protein [Sphingobium indicum]